MQKILNFISRCLNFFKQEQLTSEEVLTCIPTAWICVIHGPDSLRKRLEAQYDLTDGELGDAELVSRLKTLLVKGRIDLEVRQWQNPIDRKFYLHQQCRIARPGNPNAHITQPAPPRIVPA